jgi:parallel beta-helix repeat protein
MPLRDWFQGKNREPITSGRRRSQLVAPAFHPQLELLERRELLCATAVSSVLVASGLPTGISCGGLPGHHLIVVHEGASIQAAVDLADPGSSIYIEPGTYAQSVTVAKPGISLIGLYGGRGSKVIISNPGKAENGITVTAASSGFTLENVTVRGFTENGVRLEGVNGFDLEQVVAQNNGEYGLFPVFSSHGLIADCAAFGHKDTGIYVGQSKDVIIRQNTTVANVNGIEVENSSHVQVINNQSSGNVAGILVVLLPGLNVKVSSDIVIRGNYVHDNNLPNFAVAGNLESFVPTGSGILVVGGDHTVVENNRVWGNQFVGIGVSSTLLLGQLAGLPPGGFADIQPNPIGTLVRNNIAVHNGSASPLPFLPGADFLWDGSGRDNHWQGNLFGTSVPALLP